MQIQIEPEFLETYIGKKYTFGLRFLNNRERITWAGIQIQGTITSLNQSYDEALSPLIGFFESKNQGNKSFNHVVSGSSMICENFQTPKAFCISLTANSVCPTYEGIGISISYELFIFGQINNQQAFKKAFPIKFIGQKGNRYEIEKSQINSKFDFIIDELDFSISRYIQISPFSFVPIPRFLTKIPINNDSYISLEIDIATYIGGYLVYTIDLTKAIHNLQCFSVKLEMIELFLTTGLKDKSIIATSSHNLVNTIRKTSKIVVPLCTYTEFCTEIFTISYQISFIFHSMQNTNDIEWIHDVTIHPPQGSFSIPMVPIYLN